MIEDFFAGAIRFKPQKPYFSKLCMICVSSMAKTTPITVFFFLMTGFLAVFPNWLANAFFTMKNKFKEPELRERQG
jgi:hypothetical protein